MADVNALAPTESKPQTLIVIPVYNGADFTCACIESILASGVPAAHILVVDNGSTDGTPDLVAHRFPGLDVRRQTNLGFSSAVNVGLRVSMERGCRYTWTLNSDTVVCPETLTALEAFMDDATKAGVGACSPVIYRFDQPDQVDFAGGRLDPCTWDACHIRDIASGCAVLARRPSRGFLTGCALFMRNRAITDIGLFDEAFFMYGEDCDLSTRLTKAGWSLALAPAASVLHKIAASSGGETSPSSCYYIMRNRFLLWRKHSRGQGRRWTTLLCILSSLAPEIASLPGTGIAAVQRARVQGLLDGLRGRFGPRSLTLNQSMAEIISALAWFAIVPRGIIRRLRRQTHHR